MLKNGGFTAVNILGLSLGIASCLIIMLYVFLETSYDTYHNEPENIFRVYNERTYTDKTTYGASLPVPFSRSVDNKYSEVKDILEIRPTGNKLFKFDGLTFYESKGLFASTKIFDFFTFEVLSGQISSSFDTPNKIIVTKSLAQKYFGDSWPESVGQSILVDNSSIYNIEAVIDDLPNNFHLSFDYILPLESLELLLTERDKSNWLSPRHYVYFKLNSQRSKVSIEDQLRELVKTEVDPKTVELGYYYRYYLQPLTDIHLYSTHISFDIASHGNAQYVKGLSIIAILILLLACSNFVSISTARESLRSKEVGLRKVSGARRWEIALQFLGESFLIVFVAAIIGSFIVEITLPFFNLLVDKKMYFSLLNDVKLIVLVIALLLFTSILAGGYTAFYISGIQPSRVLKELKGTAGFNRLRKWLVIFQFTITMALLAGSVLIYQQLDFLQNKPLGLNKEQIIVIPVTQNLIKNISAIKEQLVQSPAIVSSTASYGLPGKFVQGDNISSVETDSQLPISMYLIDDDFLTTLDLELVAGRDYNESIYDQNHGYIVNEKTASMLGHTPESAIGVELIWEMWVRGDTVKQGPIIGVVKDFNYRSLQDEIGPVVLHQFRERVTYLSVKVLEANKENALTYIENVYKSFEPDRPFNFSFMDTDFERYYSNERMLSHLLKLFTGLAILIALMGLFGLAAYSTQQKRKELSIRKIHGASMANLFSILYSDLIRIMLISAAIAFPVIFYLLSDWLSNYANRIVIGSAPFILTFSLVGLLSFTIMLYYTSKAINTNPANVLRNE